MQKAECRSIYDLAKVTGVSYATVSRVLNGRDRTSAATREAVLKAAAEYNFKPRMKARRQTVGIVMGVDRILEEGRYGYMDTVLLRLLNELSNKSYSIEIFTTHNLANLRNCLLDGLITTGWDDFIAETMERMPNLPVVLINTGPIPGCSRVFSDHGQGGRLAATHLLERDHSAAGIILDSRNWGNLQRAEGFCQAFQHCGGRTLVGYLDEQNEAVLIKNMLAAGVSAFFLAGEDTILQLCGTIRLLGSGLARPPTLISMENPSLSRFLDPPLTTVAQPFRQIVTKAVELVTARLDGETRPPEEIKLDNTLIVRGNDTLLPAP